jgi:hypothetical protein
MAIYPEVDRLRPTQGRRQRSAQTNRVEHTTSRRRWPTFNLATLGCIACRSSRSLEAQDPGGVHGALLHRAIVVIEGC